MRMTSTVPSGCAPPRAGIRDCDPIDAYVGARIKLRRTLIRISQGQLARDIGVTFQQVQKYESGYNRVSASRLFNIARTLECSVGFFFEDLPTGRAMPAARTDGTTAAGVAVDPMQRTESLELVRAYWQLNTPELRRSILALMTNIERNS